MVYDVIIIGCGVVGAAMAYTLGQRDVSVCVLEKHNDICMGATKANSAILHAGFDCPIGSVEAKLNLPGIRMAREICNKLDVRYRDIPTFVIAFDEREMGELRILYERGVANGVPGVRIISREEALEMEPNLNPNIIAALYAPESGVIDPWEYCYAMAETAVRNGVRIETEAEVTSLDKAEDGHFIVHTVKGDFEARYVMNAGGGFSGFVDAMAGGGIGLKHTNFCGQYFVLDKNQCGVINSVVFPCPDEHGFKGVLVAPTTHGNLIVGPDCYEVEDGSCVHTDPQLLPELHQHGHRSVPCIDFSQVIHEYAGVRPNVQIPDFIIGESPVCKNFINLAGIKSPGLSAAPAIALEGLKELERCGLEAPVKESYVDERHVVRFKEMSREEQAALVEKDPRYGRVICRCETITEGEILDAIHRPIQPKTIDGVKRRCGAGLGRCQGGFCSPRVHALLSRELGIPMEEVLMDRAGTYVLTGRTKEAKQDEV